MDARQTALVHWLKNDCSLLSHKLKPLAGDASFRRYFRVSQADVSYIAMDAPPPRENCRPFVAIARALKEQGLSVPEIIGSDVERGFLLLSDLGDRLYLNELSLDNAEVLYGRATDALAILQSCSVVHDWEVPLFSADFMVQELQLFKEWFLQKHLALVIDEKTETMLNTFFYFLAESAANQTQVFMHRDYHSANLMVLKDEATGLLDFQDAFIGPVTYDLVSLLRDCYIDWPEVMVKKLALQYKEKIGSLIRVSDEQFLRWFDLMGLQRHLKALLTFSRKLHRDGSRNYLQHMPRTLNYVLAVSAAYPECREFNHYLVEAIMPAFQKVS